ncbi:probable ATP-dependent RNA helicase DHX35 [Diaphorina citri]|uniref:Probable ATP-dependent RNA helicase DHX35 n=1 Tax=Diaphorina citri TaxID=121845 RepID=A0A3Q0IW90_DIACI|nr:probable ATP-dependent RNA helicase DHX35 [Diaphorina citri]
MNSSATLATTQYNHPSPTNSAISDGQLTEKPAASLKIPLPDELFFILHFHVRVVDFDLLLKTKKRTQLKLIISSATVDAEEICQFYNISASSNATILSVKGHLYPVSVYYSNDPVVNYVQGVVDTAIKIHESMPVGDILAFVIGLEQIEHIIGILKQYHNQREDLKLLILPMHGSLPNNEQIKVFRPTPRAMRKIVIATNIAETSITIPGIVYVIDPGFVKARWFNPNTLTNSLVVVPISKASAVQRAGRAGRYLLEAGWCYDTKLIGITEPRRISVTSLANRVSEELRTTLGHTVGYTIRFDDCTTEDVTKIKYMTEGILMREMMTDPLLRKYSVIMLDEVHERTIFTDILMGLLKKILKTTVSESAETSSDCLPLPQFNPSEKRLSLREERDAAITTIMTKEQEKEQLEAEIIALKAELSESETVIQNLRKSRSTMEASWAADKMELETLRKRINTPVVI